MPPNEERCKEGTIKKLDSIKESFDINLIQLCKRIYVIGYINSANLYIYKYHSSKIFFQPIFILLTTYIQNYILFSLQKLHAYDFKNKIKKNT